MNDHLHVGPHGLRLLRQWEAGPRDGSVPLSPNGAALRAYLCPGGKWTLGWGCTLWPDGADIKAGDTLQNEEQAESLLRFNLIRFEEAVRHLVTVPLNENQFSAHVLLAFNIGVGAYAESSALDAANDGNHELAASKFGLFTGATSSAPSRSQIMSPDYADCIQEYVNAKGKTVYRWIGPDGQPCGYMTRYAGLLARHYSEGLLSLGLDWEEACKPGVVSLRTTPPSKKTWNPKRNRWEDGTLTKTDFAEVLAVARRFPLSEAKEEEDYLFDANAPLPERDEDPAEYGLDAEGTGSPPAEPVPAVVEPGPQVSPAAPVPTKSPVPSAAGPEPAAAAAKPAASAAPPVVAPPAPNPAETEMKDMLLSKRFWGMFVAGFGSLNFLPEAVTGFFGSAENRELIAWAAVVIAGYAFYRYGQHKATKALK